MDVSYKTKAIILTRERFMDSNSRVVAFSRERGRLELIARGTDKLTSKLAAHIEPASLSEIMVIRGKRQDYVGGAVTEAAYRALKGRFETALAAAATLTAVREMIGGTEPDERIFFLLKTFLELLEETAALLPTTILLLQTATLLKLSALLGFTPQLQTCAICGGVLMPTALAFSPAAGGLVCGSCPSEQGAIAMSADAVKVLRLCLQKPLAFFLNVTVPETALRQAEQAIKTWREYYIA